MSYEQLVRKYEGKKRGLLILLAAIEIISLALIVGSMFFMKVLFEDVPVPEAADRGGLLSIIPVFIALIIAFTFAEAVIVWQKKKVRGYFRRIQEKLGLTNDELFAEVINASNTLPALKNVFVSDEYLINLDSFWGCRIDSITGLRVANTDGFTSEHDAKYTFVEVSHDGTKNGIYTSELNVKKVYKALNDIWRRNSAAR